MRCERCNCKPVHHELAGGSPRVGDDASLDILPPCQPVYTAENGLPPPPLVLEDDATVTSGVVGSECTLPGCTLPVSFNPNTGEEFTYCSLHQDARQDASTQLSELARAVQDIELTNELEETVDDLGTGNS